MREAAKRKQNIIQSILDQNAELLKLNNSYVNNSISQYVENGSRNNEKNQENSSRQISEKLKLKSGQRKDLQDNKENKKHSQVKWKKEEKKEYLYCRRLHIKKHNWFRVIQRSYSKNKTTSWSNYHRHD